jgi:OOP family OmpA-OmpF porin
MKNVYRIGGLASSIAVGLLFANTVIAHEGGKVNESYVGDSNHHYVTDSSGNCVRTSSWKVEDMTVECGAEPPVVAAAAPPAPPPAPVYEKNTMAAEALFDHDKSALKPAGKAALHDLDESIKAKGARVVDINVIGHTDSDGTEEYNQALSIRRAESVRDYMVSEGVDPSIIDVSGEGESNPVASNATKEGRAENRRVEIHVGVVTPME